MNLYEKFDKAFQTDNKFAALRETLLELRREGVSKEDLLDSLEAYRSDIQTEEDEDLILDFMDNLYGHTAKDSRID